MGAPQSLPAGFFEQNPDTLPADFFPKRSQSMLAPQEQPESGFMDRAGEFVKGAAAGIVNPILHPLDTLESMGRGIVASGTTGAGYPTVAPTGNRATDAANLQNQQNAQIQASTQGAQMLTQHPAYMAGSIAGPAAAGYGISKISPEVLTGKAQDLYQSALKPSTRIPPAKTAAIVQAGLDSGIPVSGAGLEKLGGLIDDLNDKIAATIQVDPTRPINKFAVTSRLGQTAQRFATQVNPEADLNAVSDAGNEFLRNQPGEIPAADAQAIKQGTYQQLSGKAYGEMKSASIEAQKSLARGIKEELANAFPELNDLNAADSKLLNLQPVLEKAVQRIGNQQLVGIGTPLVIGAGKAASGSSAVGIIGGLVKAVIDNPVVKSRLAISLNKAGVNLPTAMDRIAGYSTALGQAAAVANSAPPADQNTQPDH